MKRFPIRLRSWIYDFPRECCYSYKDKVKIRKSNMCPLGVLFEKTCIRYDPIYTFEMLHLLKT